MAEETPYVVHPVVRIHDLPLSEPSMLADVLARAQQYQHAKAIDIYVQARVPADAPLYKNPGFAEYVIVTEFEGGGRLTVGAIQRQVGAATEFHS